MTGTTNAYNSVQKSLGNIQVITTYVDVGNANPIIYTCPAGKTATILALADQNVALGNNSFMNLIVKSVNLRRMVALEAGLINENIQGSLLQAGDTIVRHGDGAGQNGTMAVFLTIQELPA